MTENESTVARQRIAAWTIEAHDAVHLPRDRDGIQTHHAEESGTASYFLYPPVFGQLRKRTMILQTKTMVL